MLAQLSRNATLALSLKPLAPADAMLLIDEVAGPALAVDVRRRICRLADGNPLLLVEFAKVACENPDALNGSLPLSLKALVADRLARFDADDVDVLRVAAVMGQFDPHMLSDIAGTDEARVVGTLRKARDASIVSAPRTKDAPFIFRHALIRHAITDDLLAFEVERLHARVAERLEQTQSGAHVHSRLAHHYFHAGNAHKSQHYNEVAGDEAAAVYAYSDAAQHFERAIAGRALTEATWSLYERLADAYVKAQRAADAVRVTEQLFDYALAAGDQLRIAESGFELSRRTYGLLDDEGSIVIIRRAIEAIDAQAHPELAFNLHATHAWYLAHLRRTDEAAAVLERAKPLFESGTWASHVRYYEARAAYSVHTNDAAAYRKNVGEKLALVRAQDDPYILARGLDSAMGLAMASNIDDVAFAMRCCEELWQIATRVPAQPFAASIGMSAWIAYLYGDLDRARAALAMAFPAGDEAPLLGFYIARAGIPIALRSGDALLLRRSSRPQLLQQAFASNSPNVFGPIAASVAEHLRVQGRTGEATVLVNQAIRRLADGANNVPLVIEAARLGAAEALARGLPMLAEMTNSTSAQGGWHLANAYCAAGKERRDRALAAAQAFARIPWPLFEAEALEVAGESDRALAVYRSCGAAAEVARIEGYEARRSRNALTRREWDVAQLVASGKSNKAIAQALSLSERTVENHIASIFAKLNMRSRAEVASHIAREAAKSDLT
jgi:DNA-binding CsgD family transcriptional regulator